MRIERNAPHEGWEPIGNIVSANAPPGATIALYRVGDDLVFEIITPGGHPVAVFMTRADSRAFQDAAWAAMANYWGMDAPPPARKAKPATPEERARMAELYAAGRSVPEIARELGRSESLVYHSLDEAEITFRRKRKRRPLGE